MSLTAHIYHDSLPYIDPPLPASLQAKAEAMEKAELELDGGLATRPPHPSLPEEYNPRFTEMFSKEVERVSRGEKLEGGIDMGRYELDEEFPPRSPLQGAESGEVWEEVLKRGYASSTHLGVRLGNLNLLNEFGKNAWLVHNSQLEDVLRGLEGELVGLKGECDGVNRERKSLQEGVRGEMEVLERKWREGVGRVLEVEVGSERVRGEVLRVRREGAK